MQDEIAHSLFAQSDAVASDINKIMFERLQNASTWSTLEVMQDLQVQERRQAHKQFSGQAQFRLRRGLSRVARARPRWPRCEQQRPFLDREIHRARAGLEDHPVGKRGADAGSAGGSPRRVDSLDPRADQLAVRRRRIGRAGAGLRLGQDRRAARQRGVRRAHDRLGRHQRQNSRGLAQIAGSRPLVGTRTRRLAIAGARKRRICACRLADLERPTSWSAWRARMASPVMPAPD